MNPPDRLADVPAQPISFTLDGKTVQAQQGDTIFQAAQRLGVDIPHLCYREGHRADGNCRACVVEIQGERTLAPSCCRVPAPGMKVRTDSERAVKSRRLVLELLLADMPDEGLKWVDGDPARGHGELSYWAHKLGVKARPELKALRDEMTAQVGELRALVDRKVDEAGHKAMTYAIWEIWRA